MKHLVERNTKEISGYLRDKQIECCTFNIIQHHPTTENNDSDKDVKAKINKYLMQHCIVVKVMYRMSQDFCSCFSLGE